MLKSNFLVIEFDFLVVFTLSIISWMNVGIYYLNTIYLIRVDLKLVFRFLTLFINHILRPNLLSHIILILIITILVIFILLANQIILNLSWWYNLMAHHYFNTGLFRDVFFDVHLSIQLILIIFINFFLKVVILGLGNYRAAVFIVRCDLYLI